MTEYVPQEEMKMQLRRAWLRWVSGIVVAVVVAYGWTVFAQRDNQVDACVRGGNRAVIQTRFFVDAALKNRRVADLSGGREAQINDDAADGYENDAMDMVLTLPPTYKYDYLFTADRKNRGAVAAEVRKSCKEAFPPPIPNVS